MVKYLTGYICGSNYSLKTDLPSHNYLVLSTKNTTAFKLMSYIFTLPLSLLLFLPQLKTFGQACRTLQRMVTLCGRHHYSHLITPTGMQMSLMTPEVEKTV